MKTAAPVQNFQYCHGEPSINNACPNREICRRYAAHKTFMAIQPQPYTRAYTNAYECVKAEFYAMLLPSIDEDKQFVTLSNGFVVRWTGKRQATGLYVYKIIVPIGSYRPLVFDGNTFYTTDNMTTLEPCYPVDAKIISSHSTKSVHSDS